MSCGTTGRRATSSASCARARSTAIAAKAKARAKAAPSSAAPTRANTRAFPTAAEWSRWLRANHARANGIWIRFFKKDTGVATVTLPQALDEALCWGWIDGQARPYDARSWLQRYTPRRARSAWSKRNRGLVARLEREGRMQPSGRAQVEAAQRDGRWERAYDSPANLKVPGDFLKALRPHRKAMAFFRTLNRANLFAICYRLQTAKKPETRQRRLEAFVQMMKDGRKLH